MDSHIFEAYYHGTPPGANQFHSSELDCKCFAYYVQVFFYLLINFAELSDLYDILWPKGNMTPATVCCPAELGGTWWNLEVPGNINLLESDPQDRFISQRTYITYNILEVIGKET